MAQAFLNKGLAGIDGGRVGRVLVPWIDFAEQLGGQNSQAQPIIRRPCSLGRLVAKALTLITFMPTRRRKAG